MESARVNGGLLLVRPFVIVSGELIFRHIRFLMALDYKKSFDLTFEPARNSWFDVLVGKSGRICLVWRTSV